MRKDIKDKNSKCKNFDPKNSKKDVTIKVKGTVAIRPLRIDRPKMMTSDIFKKFKIGQPELQILRGKRET
jgi:hypothetical protein